MADGWIGDCRSRVGVRREARRSGAASPVGRIVRRFLVSLVVLACSVVGFPAVAGAAGLAVGTPDSSGNYAVCNVALRSNAPAFTSDAAVGYTSDQVVGATAYQYASSMSVSLWCNTAFNHNASFGYGLIVGQFGPTFYDMSSYKWHDYYGTGTCGHGEARGQQCFADGHGRVDYMQTDQYTHYSSAGNGPVVCLSAAYFLTGEFAALSASDQAQDKSADCAGTMQCTVGSDDHSLTLAQYNYDPGTTPDLPCRIESLSIAGAGTPVASAPGTAWGAQTASLPSPTAPLVTCSAAVSVSAATAALSALVTASAGTVVTGYDWTFGDGSSDVTTSSVNHVYTGAQPVGGWDTSVAVTVVGDGVTRAATTVVGHCARVVDFISGPGAGAGGGTADTSTGGTAPPSSCSWTDIVCNFEVSIAWLFVPTSGFYSAWSSFVGTLQTHVPFSYLADSATFVAGSMTTMSTAATTASCTSILPNGGGVLGSPTYGGIGDQGGCNGAVSSLHSLVNGILMAAFVLVAVLGIYQAIRRVMDSH